jgi:Xaa-Pro aminopeptidase
MGGLDLERQQWVMKTLRDNSLDAFVCATSTNVLMLTGYWPVIGKSVAVFSKEGSVCVVAPEDEFELAAASGAEVVCYSPASSERPISLPEALSEPLSRALRQVGLASGQIGIETKAQLIPGAYVSVHVFGNELAEILGRAAPRAMSISADRLLRGLRSRLTKREVERLRLACSIAGDAFGRCTALLTPGRTEQEVAAAIRSALSVCVGRDDVHRTDGFVFCMSGANGAEAYKSFQASTDRRLQEGDLALVHCNSFVDGFWTDITRTYPVGRIGQRECDVLSAIAEARSAALDAVRPGVRAEDVDAAARREMERCGFGKEFRHGTGHGVGFVAIDHDAPPRLTPGSPDLIEVGMAFNVEPGAYFEGWGGARHCDMVLCGEDGAEVISEG